MENPEINLIAHGNLDHVKTASESVEKYSFKKAVLGELGSHMRKIKMDSSAYHTAVYIIK